MHVDRFVFSFSAANAADLVAGNPDDARVQMLAKSLFPSSPLVIQQGNTHSRTPPERALGLILVHPLTTRIAEIGPSRPSLLTGLLIMSRIVHISNFPYYAYYYNL